MRLRAFLVPVLCVAPVLLEPCARASLAGEQCGSPVLALEDLKSLARDAATADRVAPHSFYLRDGQLRSVLESLREPITRVLPTVERLGSYSAAPESWQPGFGLPGLHEYPSTAVEYHGQLVISGWLRSAGHHPVRGIARWTDLGWEPLGDGVLPAFTLAILGDRLYAGEWSGGGVAAWDGQSWTRLPRAPLNNLSALFVHDGVLIAAGTAGQLGRVARFDGKLWQLLGGGFDTEVAALGSYRGELVAGGRFRQYKGAECGYVARWDGTTWRSLGSGIDPADYGGVSAIEEFGDRLIVGGWFSSCGFVASPGLAAWDGTSWSALPGAPAARVNDLHVMDGKLYVAGAFAGDYAAVARWDGASWSSEGLGQWVLGLATYGGRLAAVGGFYDAACRGGGPLTGVATLGPDGWSGLERWDPSMHGIASNAGAATLTSVVTYRGDLVVAGVMGLAGSPPEWKRIASPVRWDGQAWQSVGEGVSCAYRVDVVGDDLIAGGWLVGYSSEGPLNGIARWDGAEWHRMGSGLDGVLCAVAGYQGKIYAGGELRILATGQATTLAVFDGLEWSVVPFAPNTAQWNTPRVSALEVMDGHLYVGGDFEGAQGIASPSVVAWDGRRWLAVGRGVTGQVFDLESFRGDLYAAGSFRLDGPSCDGLVRWNGSEWSSLGLETCQANALGRYGNKLVISGLSGVDRFVPGSRGLVSWDGERWGGFGAGVNGSIWAIRQVGSDLVVGGWFSYAGDQVSFSIARWAGSEPPPSVDPPRPRPESPGRLALSSTIVSSEQARVWYSLPEAGPACLEVFDARGARVATLHDGFAVAGDNLLAWTPGSPAPFPRNGIYFLRLTSQGETANAKVVFSR